MDKAIWFIIFCACGVLMFIAAANGEMPLTIAFGVLTLSSARWF